MSVTFSCSFVSHVMRWDIWCSLKIPSRERSQAWTHDILQVYLFPICFSHSVILGFLKFSPSALFKRDEAGGGFLSFSFLEFSHFSSQRPDSFTVFFSVFGIYYYDRHQMLWTSRDRDVSVYLSLLSRFHGKHPDQRQLGRKGLISVHLQVRSKLRLKAIVSRRISGKTLPTFLFSASSSVTFFMHPRLTCLAMVYP